MNDFCSWLLCIPYKTQNTPALRLFLRRQTAPQHILGWQGAIFPKKLYARSFLLVKPYEKAFSFPHAPSSAHGKKTAYPCRFFATTSTPQAIRRAKTRPIHMNRRPVPYCLTIAVRCIFCEASRCNLAMCNPKTGLMKVKNPNKQNIKNIL